MMMIWRSSLPLLYCHTFVFRCTTVTCSQLCDFVAGQVLSRQNIENVIKFAKREKLLILADEVRTL